MIQDVVMPSLGLTMEEGTILEWYCSVGDAIELGADFFLLETEKSEVEIEAPYEGILTEILVEPGQTVAVGAPIARIAMDGDGDSAARSWENPPPAAAIPTGSAASTPSGMPSSRSAPAPAAARQPADANLRATPLARRVAADAGIELGDLIGSGPGGRVQRRDVDAAAAVVSPRVTAMDRRRAIVAERMHASSITTAPVTLTTRAKAGDLVRLRNRLVDRPPEGRESRPSYNDIIVAACAAAIRDHPDITLQLHDGMPRVPERINIGLAVQAPAGLIVPVIKGADALSIFGLARESGRLIDAAMTGRLAPHDLDEGTFTVSNLGAEGIDTFTPVINLPESAILGVGAIRESVEVVDGAPAVTSMVSLSLTFDHRTIDGQPAARFLKQVVELLEYPYDLRVT